jgi:hypothetical protein
MNEEQKKQYADGIAQHRLTGARMYGAMSIWKEMATVPMGVRVRMNELVAEYEQGQALIAQSMEPAVQTRLTLGDTP